MNQVVVITGSTAGIGLGLAKAFLQSGCSVVISGRDAQRCEQTARQLAEKSADRVFACACDVRSYAQTAELWNAALARFQRIDIWINNAGTINPQDDFTKQTPEIIGAVIDTNLLGTIHGCKVALEGMKSQGFGQIYNMEGYGHDGSIRNGMTLYGTSKYGIRYFTDSLNKELKDDSLRIGTLGPGIVITDLLVDAYRKGAASNRKWANVVFNVMADPVDTVCPWLASKVLKNNRPGKRIAWLTLPRMLHHILTFPFRKKIWDLEP